MGDAGFSLAGGCDMVQIAQSYGVDAELYLVPGANTHVGYSNAQVEECTDGAAAFFAAKIP